MIPRALYVRRGYIHLALQAGLLFLAVRLIVIQSLQHESWRAEAERAERATIKIQPQRGHILDRNGFRIAVTTRASSVCANPRAIPAERRGEVAHKLAALLNLKPERIASRLQRPGYFAWIKRKVSDEEADAVERARLPGVRLESESCRRYPNGPFLCHVLGFVGMDGYGLEGLEARFDTLLAGTAGEEPVLRDGLGRSMRLAPAAPKPAADGHSLVLTIDARIQRIVEEELAAAGELHKPESACAIVLDPVNGDVLAMAGWPPFDPSRFQESPRENYRNMAVVECLEPGSTFKPFVVAAALAHGVVTPETTFNCHRGRYRIGSRLLHDAHPLGRLSVRDIVAYSSNIGMAQVGARLGSERMYEALVAFGFGRATGIELPGETPGILRRPGEWSRYTISSIPMGQEIAVSPLQLAAGFAVFANGGWYVPPRIVLGVADGMGLKMLRTADRPRPRRVLSERLARLMCNDLLVAVVERGTARGLAVSGRGAGVAGYRLAGKTGTAQIARTDGGGYEPEAYCALFVGIVPADAPRFVIALVARRPGGDSQYGGVVAAPAVGRMAERILSMCRVPRDRIPPRGGIDGPNVATGGAQGNRIGI